MILLFNIIGMNQEQKPTKSFWIGQQGDIEEDCFHNEDSHYYIGLPENWTRFTAELFLDFVMSLDKKLTRLSKENEI